MIGRHVGQNLVQAALCPPAGNSLDAGHIWYAALHVFEPRAIRLRVRYKMDLPFVTVAGGHSQHPTCEAQDGDFGCGAHVENLAHSLGATRQGGDGSHCVVDMKKAAALIAIAVDRQGFAGQGLLDQTGDDHSIAPRLPRAYGIEQPKDNDRQAHLLVIRQGQKLVDGLGVE